LGCHAQIRTQRTSCKPSPVQLQPLIPIPAGLADIAGLADKAKSLTDKTETVRRMHARTLALQAKVTAIQRRLEAVAQREASTQASL